MFYTQVRFFGQHVIAIDALLDELEGKIDRIEYDDLANQSGELLDWLGCAARAYYFGEREYAESYVCAAQDAIDEFLELAFYYKED